MGINIDINTLVGKMHDVAKEIDNQGDKNGLINDEELSIFSAEYNKLIAQGETTAQEVDQIFGFEKSEETKTFSSQATTTPQEFSKKEMKRKENGVNDAVKAITKSNVTPEKLITSLKERFTGAEYQPIIAEVEALYNAVKATNYNSKEDIEKIHDTVKKELKSAKKWDGFHKDILGYFEASAKNDQINKEFNALVGMYNDVKAACNKENLAQNFEEYYKVVEGELEKKGTDGKKLIDKSYNKEALKMLKDYVEQDAKMLVRARLADETDGEGKRAIRKELREAAGDDDFQKEAIQDIKTERKIFARKHKVEHKTEELSHVSREELKKQLAEMGNQYNFAKKIFSRKKIANDILEKLERSYLEKVKNEDGTYDLSGLSDAILSRTGADYKVNQSTDDKMDEAGKIKERLSKVTGEDFSDNEIGVLVNLFDFKREHVDRTPKIVKAVVGGISSAAAAFSSSPKLHMQQTVQITLANQSLADPILKELESQGVSYTTTELTKGKIAITVNQEMVRDTRFTDALKGAGIGILASALMDVAFGEKTDEKSCISISDYDINDPTYTDAGEYKKYVATIFSKAPEKVEALQKLVDVYHDEYGNDWDIHFQQALRDIAGIGSKLNPEECLMIRYQKVKTQTPQQPVTTTPVTTIPVVTTPVVPVVTTPVNNTCDATITPKTNSFKYTRQDGDTWKGMVEAFYPCLTEDGTPMFNVYKKLSNGKYKLVKEGATTKLKRALSYNEDGTFNNEKFTALLKGGDLPKTMFLPDKIENCERVDAKRGNKYDVFGKGKALIQEVGYADGGFVAGDGCDENITAYGKTKEEALANLKDKTKKTYTNEEELLK